VLVNTNPHAELRMRRHAGIRGLLEYVHLSVPSGE
jgi:hypothetical protein